MSRRVAWACALTRRCPGIALRVILPTEGALPGSAFYWAELRSKDFKGLDPERTIAILPVAAIEQHGPHLPVMTDSAIAEGMIALLKERPPPEVNVFVLPIQSM